MTTTEKNLNKMIEQLEAKVEKIEHELSEANDKVDNLQDQIATDAFTWASPREWDENGLPLPRLEMHWERDDDEGYTTRCTYGLVFPHFLDTMSGPDDRNIVMKPFSQTTRSGSRQGKFVEKWGPEERLEITTPFRMGPDAAHAARVLNLPLYITTEDDDVSLVVLAPRPADSTQKMLRIAGKHVP